MSRIFKNSVISYYYIYWPAVWLVFVKNVHTVLRGYVAHLHRFLDCDNPTELQVDVARIKNGHQPIS
jgi:hypothetical protein